MVIFRQAVLRYIFVNTFLSISNKVDVVAAVLFWLFVLIGHLAPSSEASEDKTNFHLF